MTDLPFFTMKPRKWGLTKHMALTSILCCLLFFVADPYLPFGVLAIAYLVLRTSKKHTLVVFPQSITEKDELGRFIRRIDAHQISYTRRNAFGEILIMDRNNKCLLCVEETMSNYDRFLNWLAAHNIENKVKEQTK